MKNLHGKDGWTETTPQKFVRSKRRISALVIKEPKILNGQSINLYFSDDVTDEDREAVNDLKDLFTQIAFQSLK
jgi:hypothetical protein